MLSESLIKYILSIPLWNIRNYINIMYVCHALIISWEIRKHHAYGQLTVLHSLFITFVYGLGGTLLTSVLLGNPVSWFHSSTIIATYAIVPLLVYRCPGDALHKLFMNGEDVLSKFTLLLLTVFEGASKAFSITMGGVDAVRNHASNNVSLQSSMGAALICGILSGCGGGMLYSCFGMKSVNWSLQTPAALLSSNIAMFLSISTSALYLILTTPVVGKSTLIPMDEARAVCVLFIVFGLLWCRFGSYCKYPSSSSSDSATESTSQRKTKKSTPAASPEKASPEKKTEDKKSSGGRKRTPSRKSSRSAAMRSSSPSVSPSKGSEPSMRATRYSLRARE